MTESAFLRNFKAVVQRGNYVVLDTETTGFSRSCEIVQIAVIDPIGAILLDTLVCPTLKAIPAEATKIHGICNEDVVGAPKWGEISPQLINILIGRDVIIYNANYDERMIRQSFKAASLPLGDWVPRTRFWCAMEAFAEVYGDYNRKRRQYTWKKLHEAAAFYHIPPVRGHNAMADAHTTLHIVRALAGVTDGTPTH